MTVFSINANDTDMGEYNAATAESALDAYARDAGYSSYADLAAQCGDDAVAVQIDTDALCNAAGQHLNAVVLQDSYGSGVALINGKSFESYGELAQAIGRKVWDFRT